MSSFTSVTLVNKIDKDVRHGETFQKVKTVGSITQSLYTTNWLLHERKLTLIPIKKEIKKLYKVLVNLRSFRFVIWLVGISELLDNVYIIVNICFL